MLVVTTATHAAENITLMRKDSLQTHRPIVPPVTIYNGTLGMNTAALMH